MRVKITLRCTSCGSKNYISSKNKATHPEKVESLKFCPKERLVTLHKEE
ncbi:50S ribosomal protein L33 [Lactococcus nasutitermitis]|uniref:Large ribosomal subunit protein bL33 n=1 Tax=Lactococcus nasutitermitis TaxID=1652957 RepID=A0ABV9J9U7_9LACT|nr:50S ribosomal protein L33 [Lactococcus nasutitermitis]